MPTTFFSVFFYPDEGADNRLRPQSLQVLPDVLGQPEGRAAAGSLPRRAPGGAVQDGGGQVSDAVSFFPFLRLLNIICVLDPRKEHENIIVESFIEP